jgi:ribosomal protein S18 acetylase RimI-like enzyme
VTSGVAVHIRRGVVADAGDLAGFAARTFAETFAADNRPEDLAAHLAASYGIAQQTAELSRDDEITLLAHQQAALVAYAQVRRSPPPECVASRQPVELHRFYVDRPAHGQGVAQQLMAAVLEAAAELGGSTLWLSVWERNPRAQAFYRKMGFADVGSTVFFVGPDRQTDRVMARPLA